MENQSQSMPLTDDEFNKLVRDLNDFLGEKYDSACLDDDVDRYRVASGVARWLLSDESRVASPEVLLPKAKHLLSFNVVDEVTRTHIVRLVLERTKEMEDGHFLQLQNFFWTTVGYAIRDNPEIIRALEAGGVRVEIDPPEGAGGEQAAL